MRESVKLGHYKEWRKQYVNNKKEIAFIAIGLLSLFLGCSEFISTGFQLIGP